MPRYRDERHSRSLLHDSTLSVSFLTVSPMMYIFGRDRECFSRRLARRRRVRSSSRDTSRQSRPLVAQPKASQNATENFESIRWTLVAAHVEARGGERRSGRLDLRVITQGSAVVAPQTSPVSSLFPDSLEIRIGVSSADTEGLDVSPARLSPA